MAEELSYCFFFQFVYLFEQDVSGFEIVDLFVWVNRKISWKFIQIMLKKDLHSEMLCAACISRAAVWLSDGIF